MGTDEGSFVPSATYHLQGDGDDLDRFDPDTAARALPQPERRVARVLNGIVGDAWAKIEERHPDVVVSLSGAQQKGRELETAAVATAVARPSSNVTAARWGGDGPAPVLIVGTAAGQVLLYEPVATTGYVQDAESQATLVPFEALDAEDAEGEAEGEEDEEAEPAGPAAIGAASAVSQREPNAPCRVVVAAADDARVAVVEVYPSDCEEGPRLQLLTTIEAQSIASAVVLSRDGRWLAVASADNITLHRLPEARMEEEPAALGQISEEAAQEEFDASVAEIAKVAFVLPASGAVPTLHWVFATPMEATSLLVVKPDSHVVAKYGLRADAEDGGAPPLYAAWQMAANVSASCLLQDSDGTNSILALGLSSGTVLLWDLQIDMCREVLKRHEKAVSALAVHRHKYLIAGAADGRVHIYDLAAGPNLSPQLIAVRSDLTAPVQDLACLRDAALVVGRLADAAAHGQARGLARVVLLRRDDARRVQQLEGRRPAVVRLRPHPAQAPRHARAVLGLGRLAPRQAVDERRLAHVRVAHDGDARGPRRDALLLPFFVDGSPTFLQRAAHAPELLVAAAPRIHKKHVLFHCSPPVAQDLWRREVREREDDDARPVADPLR